MSDAQAPAPARRGVRACRPLGGVGDRVRGDGSDTSAVSPADRDLADSIAGALAIDRPPDTASTSYTVDGCVCDYCAAVTSRTDTSTHYETTTGYPDALTRTAPTNTATLTPSDYHCIPAADAGAPIADAGSDSSPSTDHPDLREWRGQRRGNRDTVRDHDRPGLSDGPRVPRRRGSPDGGLLNDDLQRAGNVGRSLQWDGQRRRGDPALLGDGRGRRIGLRDVVRRDGRRRNVGGADLYVVGVERGDGEHLQRISQRRRGAGDLSGGLT